MKRMALLGLAVGLGAAGPPPDPDWPCVQRLVPTLTAGTIWGGHEAQGDWRADPQLAGTVRSVVPRSLSNEAAAAKLDAAIQGIPPAERAAALPRLFAGLVDETNQQRTAVIDRLRGIARRQRYLTETTSAITAELRALPADAPAAQREEMTQRRAFLIREYEEIERTIRYACEVPVALEARLGQFARVLQAGLGG